MLFSLSRIAESKSILRYIQSAIYAVILGLTIGSIMLGHTLGWRQYWRYNQDLEGNVYAVRNFGWTQQFPPHTPIFILNNLETQHIFTSKLWNNYFIWYLPKAKVFSDSLWDYRTAQDLEDERSISSGTGSWQELLKAHDIDTVVNSQYDSIFDNFTPVHKLPDWKLVYVDSDAVIYARKDIIKKLPVDLSYIQPHKAYYPINLSFDLKDQDEAIKQLQGLIK